MSALRVTKLGRTIRRNDGELRVLEDADLLLVPGAAAGVTGPLDSGWRSLLRLIVGLDPRTAGSVELLGRPGEPAPPTGIAGLRQSVVFASALEPLLDRDLRLAAEAVSRLSASRRRRVRPASAA